MSRAGYFKPAAARSKLWPRLNAHDALIEFLEANRSIADPIERLGEDAVINAAARGLANVRERRVLEVFLRLAQRPALIGVIGALGAFERTEAIPVLIDALQDDASRATAESALKKLGPIGAPTLNGRRQVRDQANTKANRTDEGAVARSGFWWRCVCRASHGRICVRLCTIRTQRWRRSLANSALTARRRRKSAEMRPTLDRIACAG